MRRAERGVALLEVLDIGIGRARQRDAVERALGALDADGVRAHLVHAEAEVEVAAPEQGVRGEQPLLVRQLLLTRPRRDAGLGRARHQLDQREPRHGEDHRRGEHFEEDHAPLSAPHARLRSEGPP